VLVQLSSCSSDAGYWVVVDCGLGVVARLDVESGGGVGDSDAYDRGSVSVLEEGRVVR